MLIELFFINNDSDIEKLLNKKDEFVTAIAKGIFRFLEVEYKEDKHRYTVTTGTYANIENDRAEAKKLKDKGMVLSTYI